MITVQYLQKIIGIIIKALIMQPSYYQMNLQPHCTVQRLLKISSGTKH